MATSLIRSRAAITGVKDRFAWNEIKDGAVLQEDGVIVASAPTTTCTASTRRCP
jgi:hypothetical protein